MKHLKLFEDFKDNPAEQVVRPTRDKAYHITPDIHLESIKRDGLTPKAESKMSKHPERVYLLLNPEKTFKRLASSLWHTSRNKEAIRNYYILEIDMNQLRNYTFYADPESSLSFVGIYTKEGIPPAAIKVIEKIPVEQLPPPIPEEEPIAFENPFKDDGKSDPNRWDDLLKKAGDLPPDKQRIILKDLGF
jgi:hypothetical protein